MSTSNTMTLEVGTSSDVGRVRTRNEDAVLAEVPIFAVADGMGGHAGGQLASAIAVDRLRELVGRDDVTTDTLLTTVEQANAAIVARARADAEVAGMGTTLTGVCLGSVGGSPHWFVFNVGDSRVYRIQSGRALQLTVDHSEVAELVAAGRIAAADAGSHPLRNVVTRSLGSDPAPIADVFVVPADEGDTFVICSDGLTTEVPDADIATVVEQNAGSAQAAAEALVARAVAAGGRDNVTVVVVATRAAPALAAAAITAPRPRAKGTDDD